MTDPLKTASSQKGDEPDKLIRFGTHAEELYSKGFKLTAIKVGTKGGMYKDWPKHGRDIESIKALAKRYPKRGIGFQMNDHLIAIDVDIDDQQGANAFYETLKKHLEPSGKLIQRIGQAPRFALIVQSEQPIDHEQILITAPDDSEYKIELLAKGHQLVAFNKHSGTGKEYYYPEVSPMEISNSDELACIPGREALSKIFNETIKQLGSGWNITSKSTRSSSDTMSKSAIAENYKHSEQSTSTQFTDERVMALLEQFDPPNYKDYKFFIRVGMAIHHHFCGSEKGFKAWEGWSSRSEHHNTTDMQKWWDGFSNFAGRPITAATLKMYANESKESKLLENSLQHLRKVEASVNKCVDEQALLNQVPNFKRLPLIPHHKSALITLVYEKIKAISDADPGLKNIEKLFSCDKGKKSNRKKTNSALSILEGIERGTWGVNAYVNQDNKICLEDSSKGFLENCLLDSESGENCLVNIGRKAFNQLLSPIRIQDIGRGLKANAHELPKHMTGRRWMSLGNKCYACDFGDKERRVIYVEPDSYCFRVQGSARFLRDGTEVPFSCHPNDLTGDLELLWKYVNVHEDDKEFILAWLLEACQPDTPYPILVLTGPKGTGKTGALRAIRQIISPTGEDVGTPPTTDRDLRANAAHNPILLIDNVIGFTKTMYTTLCQISTGATDKERELGKNHRTVGANIKTPILMNCIALPQMPEDVFSRMLLVRMLPIEHRRGERDLREEFERDLPKIQAGFLTHFSKCLSEMAVGHLASLPRMADSVLTGQASLNVRGIQKKFTDMILESNRRVEGEQFDGVPILSELLKLMTTRPKENPLETTANELWERLTNSRFPISRDYHVPWPKTGQTMLAIFDRNKDQLHQEGVDFHRIEGSRPRLVLFELNANAPPQTEIF